MVEDFQDGGVHLGDFSHEAEIDDLGPVGFGGFLDFSVALRLKQAAVLAGDADGVAAMAVDERNDFLVHLAAQHHFHYIDRRLVGDALAVDELRFDAEGEEGLADLRPAAVHHHRVDADVFHHHDVAGEVFLELLGHHGMAAVFDDQGLVVEVPDEGQGLQQGFGALDAFFHDAPQSM